MRAKYRARRLITALLMLIGIAVATFTSPDLWQQQVVTQPAISVPTASGVAADALATLVVKGRAPKTDYRRTQFGDGWALERGCDMRNIILHRDLTDVAVNEACKVISGNLNDPYTGKMIPFIRGADTSDDIQIDHVVALSNAWQTGAQQLTFEQRTALANDPLELLAVEGKANQDKSASDAASWLPPNKAFRCQYIARQIAVKKKYNLWVTPAEKDAMNRVLSGCPGQKLPV